MPIEDCVQALTKLGFTPLEAEIYAFLVQESPVTGYRIAQALGKPAANVYKAIEALETKGAVLIDQGANRVCRAVPTDELLSQLDRAFQQRRSQAADALADLRVSEQDDRVYQLRSREQVFERCRSMLARCKSLALFDIFPDPLEALQPDIEATAARGVRVTLKAFVPVEVPGVDVVLNPRGTDVMANYPGQWIILIIDGAELLIASLNANRKDVHQAIWTSSVTLSWIFHCSFAAEILMTTLFHHIEKGTPLEQLQAAIAPYMRAGVERNPEPSEVEAALTRWGNFYGHGIPGYQDLLARFGSPEKREGQGETEDP
ncbi:MAG: transcriptional regulator, TrmB [Chthonomonadaceae bacterium]|nr:transcriptional regulator, TrmB [Chthonomonadaceae bacterium]